jgi:hypothetical protein
MNRVLIPISILDKRTGIMETVDGSLITWCCRLGREGRPIKHQPHEGAMSGDNQAVRSVHPSPSRDAWGLRDVGRGTPERGDFGFQTLREIMSDLRQEAMIVELRIPRL